MTRTISPSKLMVPVLLVPTFMGFLDLWIVLVALPSIRTDLGASVGAAQLVVGIYLTTYGAGLVLGGRLGDRFGRRRLLTIGVAAFTLSSVLCAVAPSPAVLVVARALQGLGAAVMLPQVLSIIQVSVPERDRNGAIGAYTSVIGAAVVSGLILGGVLLQADVLGLGWRVLFAINAPIGLAAITVLERAVPESHAPERPPLDVRGAVALAVVLILGLLGLVEGSDHGWPAWTVAAVAVSVVVAIFFVRGELALERAGRDPLVPPRLLREPPVRLGLALTLLFYIVNSGFFVVLPFLFTAAFGLGPLATGLAFAPLGVAFVISSLVSRRPEAAQGPAPMAIGAALMFASLAATAAIVNGGGGPVALALPLALFGYGGGMVYPRIVSTVLSRVAAPEVGAASGVLLTATQIANALGVVIVGGAFTAAASMGTRDAFGVAVLVALVFVGLLGLVAARPLLKR